MGFPEAKWTVDQVVSKIGVQPNNMRKFEAAALNETTIGLKFLEPEDSYYSAGGALAAVTKGVLIRMSTDGYPQGINDGTLVIDNTVLGKYENEDFQVTGLTKGTKYYFTAFPYSNIGVYNESLNAANKADAIPNEIERVSVTINIDDAKRFTSTTVTLKNVNTSEQTTVNVTETKTVMFVAKANNTYVVTATAVTGYKNGALSTEQFTAVAGGSRAFTFNFEMGFLYGIKFDNGGDGIPSSYEYLEDCAGFTAASVSTMNSWQGKRILDKFKPCLIKPGATAPEYYLNKDNYNQRAEGSAAPILTGADGDVMIEVERMWFKLVKNTIDHTATLYISEVELDGYKSFIGDQDVAYRGAYEASVAGGKMYSVSGEQPTVNMTRKGFRSQAKKRGSEYSQNDYYLLRLWQCMYLLLYGTRDSQTAIGRGRSASGNVTAINTGTMNDKPFCWGDTSGSNGMKFLGVENFYGNVWEFVDGLTIVDYVCKITEDPSKYDDVGTGYEITAGTVPSASNNYIKEMKATNDAPFLPSVVGGSETTYFCDGLRTGQGTRVASFGGYWENVGQVGAFCWILNLDSSSSYSYAGSRLCRKKVSS